MSKQKNYEHNNFMNIEDYTLITRHTVMASDLNMHNNLYGGILLNWLDEAGYIFAVETCKFSNLVTVALNNVAFKSPVKLGDIIEIYAKLNKIGRTSISIKLFAQNISVCHNCQPRPIIDCDIVFVRVDKKGKPQLIKKTKEKNYECQC
ncbi:MAG TPA: hotdog domain-containing protein [bacterium]|nr:hotdog domain-containing protein [bacterium]HPP88585.1 hotdog domain-containing protein [bacterium]